MKPVTGRATYVWNPPEAGRMIPTRSVRRSQSGYRIILSTAECLTLLLANVAGSKLRGCDVVKIRIGDLVSGGRVRARATVVQQKTGRPVQFELLESARTSIQACLERRGGTLDDYAFPSRNNHAKHLSTRQYARLVDDG